jgi:hypothetical protein
MSKELNAYRIIWIVCAVVNFVQAVVLRIKGYNTWWSAAFLAFAIGFSYYAIRGTPRQTN